jgi:hypothetical protein
VGQATRDHQSWRDLHNGTVSRTTARWSCGCSAQLIVDQKLLKTWCFLKPHCGLQLSPAVRADHVGVGALFGFPSVPSLRVLLSFLKQCFSYMRSVVGYVANARRILTPAIPRHLRHFEMSSIRMRIFAACWLVTAVTAQYGAMEIPAGLSPRYYLGGAQLLDRQVSGVGGCAANQHPCKYFSLSPFSPGVCTDR